jgi:hypothetical protein
VGAELRFDKGAQSITPVLNVISQPASTTLGGAAGLAAGGGGTSFNFSDNLPFFIVRDTKANVVNNNLGFGTVLFTVHPSGNVGVGTTSPTARLQVAGNVNVTGLRTETTASTPNVVGGFSGNSVTAGVVGAAIGGGGETSVTNRVTDSFGTVGGGRNNRAGDGAGTTEDRRFATVAGGNLNTASGTAATVSGGSENTASGGGGANVGGGNNNIASGGASAVGGGQQNTASGGIATIPGGHQNTAAGLFSFAAGRQAKALHDGAFVWGDATAADFASTAADQFLIRAAGGVGINTTSPQAPLHVAGGPLLTSTDAGNTTVTVGQRFRDNAIIAWGRILADGSFAATQVFGVAAVVRNSAGVYTVNLSSSPTTQIAVSVVAEVDAPPTTAADARLVTFDRVSTTQFRVFITNGSFASTDNEFFFIVTGR